MGIQLYTFQIFTGGCTCKNGAKFSFFCWSSPASPCIGVGAASTYEVSLVGGARGPLANRQTPPRRTPPPAGVTTAWATAAQLAGNATWRAGGAGG